jgi:hypothetical protein
MRPFQNAPFCPISASGSNLNPRNTQCIPVVKIIAFLELDQKCAFFKGLNASFFYCFDALSDFNMAEREGFEPSVPLLTAHTISSRAPSASSDISPKN